MLPKQLCATDEALYDFARFAASGRTRRIANKETAPGLPEAASSRAVTLRGVFLILEFGRRDHVLGG
jgi:hypothetical protein